MHDVFRNMEPVNFRKGEIMFNELDDCSYIIFVEKGHTDIGFNINRKVNYVTKKRGAHMVGGYSCTFNQKITYVYGCSTDI